MARRLDDDGAGHARADQHAFGHIIDMNAHWDPLSEPDPLEGRIGIGQKLGAGGIVAIGDAAADALDMAAQGLTTANRIDIDVATRFDDRDLVSSK